MESSMLHRWVSCKNGTMAGPLELQQRRQREQLMPPGVRTDEVTVVLLGVVGIERAQELLPASFLVDVLAERCLVKLLVRLIG
jgi:hypothetical protein